jgi:KDO2-lipid IV(A) lauroyltransferase
LAEFIIGNSLRKIAREHRFVQRLLWRLDFALVWSLVKLFSLLPVDWSSSLGSRVGGIIGPLMKRKTAIFEENFRIAFPEKSPGDISQLARASWRNAGRVLGEYPHLGTLLNGDGGKRLEVVVRDPATTFKDRGRPAVAVAAHLGNWEVNALGMARLGIASACLYSPPVNPWLDRMLLDSREPLNSELLPRDNSTRLLIKALNSGRTVAMVMDRRVDDGKPIPLFGRDKPTTIVPARLALKFNCDLIPVQVERLEGARFRVTFHPPVVPTNPDDCMTDQATDMIRQVHQLFESWIRQNPEEWFCSKRLWPKRPEGAPELAVTETENDSHAA